MHGDAPLIRLATPKLKSDRYGLWTGSVRFSLLADRLDLMPQVGDAHPYASWCRVETRDITFTPGRYLVDCTYVGADVIDTVPVYELQRATNVEPIETHPDFVSDIAGKPSAPLNGALFVDEDGAPSADDTRGIFHRFRLVLDGGTKNKLAGVTGYQSASNTTWSKSWTSRTKPTDGGRVGKIDTPEGGPPSFEDCDWLYMGLTINERQQVYSVSKRWLLSAPGGWNELIYG